MHALDGNWLQDQLFAAAEAKRRLLLPTEKPIKIPRMVVNDGVPLGLKPEARGPAVIRWTAKEPGAMMELRCTDLGQMSPQYSILEKIRFDGGGIASALQSWSGFMRGATLDRCHFWNCVGPVVHMQGCWTSIFSVLKFDQCKGGLVEIEGRDGHSAGIVNAISTHRCETNGDGRPALRFTGTCGSVEHILFGSRTHYPGLPLLLLDGCESKGVVDVRTEGGVDRGVEGHSVVELRDCMACGVERVRGVFNPARPGHCVVRVVGGRDNRLLGIQGGRAGTLEAGGCIVEATPGSVILNGMSVSHDVKPGQPRHYPDLLLRPPPPTTQKGGES